MPDCSQVGFARIFAILAHLRVQQGSGNAGCTSHSQEALPMRPTVLIVDDDEAITQQLFWTLSEDYEVVTANDMQTAARRARIYEPDVAILDLHFPPTLDSPEVGLRILDFLKAHVPQSRVVVISSANDIESQKACYDRGADEFFDKPFDTEKLLATMRRLAPLRQMDFG